MFRNTRYSVTPTLSVEGVHDKSIWVDETAVDWRFIGAKGGRVSVATSRVVAKTELDGSEAFPAASRAEIVYE